ncbi:tetratricopeptide repeat protein, partial [Streptomyces sp. NPDC059248]|uniref:tetratricopeptide repeat protein n=1 Tax=Streptomyces sp. NPDC059248 TaxID=3346791 RepID=UPI003697C3DE
MALFTENLSKDPLSAEDPAEFLFHVSGVGGVGKSTLLRQWQSAAERAGAVTAVVDEDDVHGVQQALVELVRQMARQEGPCKEFDKAVEQWRREQTAQVEPTPVEGEASVSSRVVSQAALGAVSLIPGVGVATAMANPDAAAQGLDRLRSASRSRGQRRGARDEMGLSRAFVAELERLCRRQRWVVLFFDTWEQTAQYLSGWLLSLLDEEFGPVPANVMVVLAGRDQLAERQWAPLRDQIADVPLEVFTEAETRGLLAARGVTDAGVVDAVLRLSMGLPLLVDLLALARPHTAEDVDAGGHLVDVAVERFVQWIPNPEKREAVLACALPLRLNEDVFAAATSEPGIEGLWAWLCGQPFVSGRGDFKHYHAVVRASMIRQQRARSPQRWTTAHLQLADTHATWRRGYEEQTAVAERWKDATWRQHQRDETYHRLCADPGTYLPQALEQVVHAAGQDTAVLRQWVEALVQAGQDTPDAELVRWSERLQHTLNEEEAALSCLRLLLTRGQLSTEARSWAHTYRGRILYFADRDEEAVTELDHAIAHNPGNAHAWAWRGRCHLWLDGLDQAITDLTAAIEIDPTNAWALARRGETHRQAGQYDQAITDFTAALEIDPTSAWALGSRGQAHQEAGRYDQAVTDLTAALEIDPTYAWALAL